MRNCAKTCFLNILTGALLTIPCLCIAQNPAAARDYLQESEKEKNARMAWFREARFGMFIHWGLYAIPAGEWPGKGDKHAEWIRTTAEIPIEEYDKLVGQFNPVKFSADEWVRMAKDAGMKYIVITSKHHDGFCLWDSKQTDYDVMATPFHRDILKELREACNKQGVRLCFYHSIMDWHHPDYLPRRKWETTRSTEGADLQRYIACMKAQLKELVQNYGPLGILWFDGEWEDTWTHEEGLKLYNYVRDLQPDIIINNRVDKGRRSMQGMSKSKEFAGDYGTPEQEIPARGLPGLDWESCMTMNRHWGYNKADSDWKSTENLVRKLIDIASKGGNFLLNIGPKSDGTFPEESVERLRGMGAWMKRNSEAIYGTTASPLGKVPFGRVTAKPGKLYLHVFDWPSNGVLAVPGLKSEVSKAYLLGDSEHRGLKVSRRGEKLVEISLPAAAPDPIASVVVLEYKGELRAEVNVNKIAADAKGVFTLAAKEAEIEGEGPLKFEESKNALGFWSSRQDRPSWVIEVAKPGKYQVELTWACAKDSSGTKFNLQVGDQDIEGAVQETGDWDTFRTEVLGTVEIASAGLHDVRVIPRSNPRAGVMNLRTIRLIPVE